MMIRVVGRFRRFGRVAVLGALDDEVGHLAFDHARVVPQPARSKRVGEISAMRVLMRRGDCQGGKNPAV